VLACYRCCILVSQSAMKRRSRGLSARALAIDRNEPIPGFSPRPRSGANGFLPLTVPESAPFQVSRCNPIIDDGAGPDDSCVGQALLGFVDMVLACHYRLESFRTDVATLLSG
jgi:hypothetical protein